MQALLVVVNVLLVLNAIILIVAVLMQDGARAGLGSIGGGAETFFGKSKAKSYEGKLEMITKVGAGVFIVLAILMTALNARVSNVSTPTQTATSEATDEAATDADATAMPEAEDTATEDEADAVEATEAPAA